MGRTTSRAPTMKWPRNPEQAKLKELYRLLQVGIAIEVPLSRRIGGLHVVHDYETALRCGAGARR